MTEATLAKRAGKIEVADGDKRSSVEEQNVGVAVNEKPIRYAFVIDADGKQLSPTKEPKAWYMVRKGKAKLVEKIPMVIQLLRVIPDEEICKDEIHCGIDDGALHTGIALVQKCQTRNKVLFKGTIEHRKDVKKLMVIRKGYRRNRRSNKRYRQYRPNRASLKKEGRVAPSIPQKRQATYRGVCQLKKRTLVTHYDLEDVAIDIRALTDGYKPYRWEYQNSNRLDENLRKAIIFRDGGKCVECGKSNTSLEVHHIIPKRHDGENTPSNLITLCHDCHEKVAGREKEFETHFLEMIDGTGNKGLSYASHVMIGKTWLRKNLSVLGELSLTTGGDTANRRIDWNVKKTHANDAICITGLKPETCNVAHYVLKPMRRKRSRLA